jgi:hypothetical protein
MANADCRGGVFDQSLWIDALLSDADFSDAGLEQCVFHRARCERTSFARSRLTCADFSYADLRAANFEKALFHRTQLHRAHQGDSRWSDRIGVLDADPDLFEAERVAWQRSTRAVPRIDRDAQGLMRLGDYPPPDAKDTA